jgi:hypothetical protein
LKKTGPPEQSFPPTPRAFNQRNGFWNSAEFRKHFLGTHFFNPPRWMKLLKSSPAKKLPMKCSLYAPFLRKSARQRRGFAKDTPNFIANRIGTYAMAYTIKLMQEMKMTIEEVDTITGPPMGHPKSRLFPHSGHGRPGYFLPCCQDCDMTSQPTQQKKKFSIFRTGFLQNGRT